MGGKAYSVGVMVLSFHPFEAALSCCSGWCPWRHLEPLWTSPCQHFIAQGSPHHLTGSFGPPPYCHLANLHPTEVVGLCPWASTQRLHHYVVGLRESPHSEFGTLAPSPACSDECWHRHPHGYHHTLLGRRGCCAPGLPGLALGTEAPLPSACPSPGVKGAVVPTSPDTALVLTEPHSEIKPPATSLQLCSS